MSEPLYRSPPLTDEDREAILYCVSCAQDYRDTLDSGEQPEQYARSTQMIGTAMRLAVGPAPAERGGATSVTHVGGAGPTLTDAEREAIRRAADLMAKAAESRNDIHTAWYLVDDAAKLRGLLERTAPARDETPPEPASMPERYDISGRLPDSQ